MRGPVDPKEARAGMFIKSFPLWEYQQMLLYGGGLENAADRNGIAGEFVYTKIANWGAARDKQGSRDTWQIFLLPAKGKD